MSCTMQITLRSIIKLHPFGILTATRSAELKSDLDLLNLHRLISTVYFTWVSFVHPQELTNLFQWTEEAGISADTNEPNEEQTQALDL